MDNANRDQNQFLEVCIVIAFEPDRYFIRRVAAGYLSANAARGIESRSHTPRMAWAGLSGQHRLAQGTRGLEWLNEPMSARYHGIMGILTNSGIVRVI